MKSVLTLFAMLAAVGLFLSILVHVTALLGLPSPLGEWTWNLHIGIFIVWLPTVLVAQRLSKDFKQKDFWKAAFRACPTWMKRMAYFFFGYAFFNFILGFILEVGVGVDGDAPAAAYRLASGHWMAFYSVALAVLYSAAHVQEHDSTRRCPNLHPVPPAARFCEECGEEILDAAGSRVMSRR